MHHFGDFTLPSSFDSHLKRLLLKKNLRQVALNSP